MSTPPRPPLEGHPTPPPGSRIAEPTPAASGSGAAKVVAEGVRHTTTQTRRTAA
ncbi:hypothetical protein [Streptomyces microflavus]|uniref:hypothetical protein n=1 Tax=Streptomyces microflavus TaxID=1919 RepID=UPI0032542DB4